MWSAKEIVAVIFAASVPLVLLYVLTLRLMGEGLPLEVGMELKEILLVITGGLVMWIGNGKGPRNGSGI